MSFLIGAMQNHLPLKPNNLNANMAPGNFQGIPLAQGKIYNATHAQPRQPQPMQQRHIVQQPQAPNQAARSYTETALSILKGGYALFNKTPAGVIPIIITMGYGSTIYSAIPSVLSAASSAASTGLSLIGEGPLSVASYIGSEAVNILAKSKLFRWGSPYLRSWTGAAVLMLPRQTALAGVVIGYAALKAYPYLADRVAEIRRRLPQPLSDAGLTKTDVPAYFAEHIAPLPKGQQQAIAAALQILKANSLLKEDFYGILVAAKDPVGIANTLCLLRNRTNGDLPNEAQYLAIWNENLEAFKNSKDPCSLASILVVLKDVPWAQQALSDSSCPLFEYPGTRLAEIAHSLNQLDQKNLLRDFLNISGNAILFDPDSLSLAKIVTTLAKTGLTQARDDFAQNLKTLCNCSSEKLESINTGLTALTSANIEIPSIILSAIIASKHPLALASIFIAYNQANLLITPLLDTLCRGKGVDASRLKEIALAFQNFPSFLNLQINQRQLLFGAVIESNHPVVFANCITILNKNNIFLTENILNAVYCKTEEMKNALEILDTNRKLNDNALKAILSFHNPQPLAEEIVRRNLNVF